ncbi:transposase [Mycobacterium sp.]|uniref:transposase n=1 Tax=Mycobacterium sp. TaxID=1785 RepID=UPI003C756B87
MIYRQVHELAADGFAVAVICRCLGVSRSGYYDWRSREPSAHQAADRELLATTTEIHTMSRYSYGGAAARSCSLIRERPPLTKSIVKQENS